jgi:hypothetical protein
MKFGHQAPGYTSLQGKISIKRGLESWIPLKKGNSTDFVIVWILYFIFEFHLLIRLVLAPNYLWMTLIRVNITRGVTMPGHPAPMMVTPPTQRTTTTMMTTMGGTTTIMTGATMTTMMISAPTMPSIS